jgi:glycosyltransferase involved in cell wall biosynthesis
MPEISIILPTYNRASWLDGCIGSVLDQTHPGWELIVCDDGSTDDSIDVISDYLLDDPRIKLLPLTHGGQAATTRSGMDQAEAPYLMMLSSDDELTPNAVGDYLDAFAATGAEVLYGDYWVEWMDSIFDGFTGRREIRKAMEYRFLPMQNVVAGSAFSASAYRAIGGWSRHWELGNDWAFYLALYASGYRWHKLEVPTYVYRYHKGGQTFTDRGLQLSDVAEIEEAYKAGLLDVRTPEGRAFLLSHNHPAQGAR